MLELPLIERKPETGCKISRYNHFILLENGDRLAYNALSNALARMDANAWERYRAIRQGGKCNPSSQLDAMLLEGKFVLPEEYDEVAFLRTSHLQARYDNTSWTLAICPTIDCNFGCDYCFELRRPGMMKPEVQDALVKALQERSKELRDFSVIWYGGEPTLGWEVIQKLSREFMEVCDQESVTYRSEMISNGYLLDANKVAELDSLRIKRVQITLDGGSEYHDQRRYLASGEGTFDRIIDNLRHFVDSPSFAILRVNVDGRNKEGVFALLEQLVNAGLAGLSNISIYFAPVVVSTLPTHGVASFCFTRKDFARLEPDYYQRAVTLGLAAMPYPSLGIGSCMAIKPAEYVVEPDGTLQKCWDTVGHKQFAVGNILEDADPLELPEYQRWLRWDPFTQDLACNQCNWLPSCMGGCPLKVVHPELSPDGKVHLSCTTFKYNSKKMLPLYAEWVGSGGQPRQGRVCEG